MNKKILGTIILSIILLSIASFTNAVSVAGMVSCVSDQVKTVGTTLVIIGWVVAGILYLTSGGGARMEVAKKAMWAALIGTVLILVSGVMFGIINTALHTGASGAAGATCGT